PTDATHLAARREGSDRRVEPEAGRPPAAPRCEGVGTAARRQPAPRPEARRSDKMRAHAHLTLPRLALLAGSLQSGAALDLGRAPHHLALAPALQPLALAHAAVPLQALAALDQPGALPLFAHPAPQLARTRPLELSGRCRRRRGGLAGLRRQRRQKE